MIPEFKGYQSFPASISDDMWSIWPRVNQPYRYNNSQTLFETLRGNIEMLNRNINLWVTYKTENKWQSPQETWELRSGDCKDYATLKRALLIDHGWAKDEDLAVVIGEIKSLTGNTPHAWCACRLDGQWLVLDNKFDQLITSDDYINWLPLKACSGTQVYLYGKTIVMAKA